MGDGRYLIRAEVLVMKKLFALLLVLAMLLGCAAFAEAVDYVGTWVLTGVEAEALGMQMGPDMLQVSGMDFTMTLNADGTAVLNAAGEEEAGNWTATETGVSLTDASGVTDVLVYQDEILVMEQDGTAMMFTREGAAPAIADAPAAAVLANVDPKAFEGQWLLTKASMMGMEFPAESLGMYMALMLSEGSGNFGTTDDNGELVSAEITYTVSEVEGVGTALDVIVTDAETGESAVMMTLNMQSDGSLVYNLDMDGMVIAYVFTAVTEEAAE